MVTRGVYSAMKVIPKDIFGNKADIEEEAVEIEIRKVKRMLSLCVTGCHILLSLHAMAVPTCIMVPTYMH